MPDFQSYPPQARGHGRTLSSASSMSASSARSHQSNASSPTPTMEHLMRTIAQAPKGSKIGQDAAKALLIAERERHIRTGVPLSPIPSPRIMDSHGEFDAQRNARPQSPMHAPVAPLRIRREATHGSMSTSPTSPRVYGPHEDPFGLDVPEDVGSDDDVSVRSGLPPAITPTPTFTQDPQGMPQWPAIPSYPPRNTSLQGVRTGMMPEPKVPQEVPVPLLRGISRQQPALAIFWRGDVAQTFTLVTVGTGAGATDDAYPLQVAPNHTQIIEVPERWEGYVQRSNDIYDMPATRAHVAFNAYRRFSFFYVDYSHGHNGPVYMATEPTGDHAGSSRQVGHLAPPSIVGRTPNGSVFIRPTEEGSTYQRNAVTHFYRNFFSSAQDGAIVVADTDAATQATKDRHIVLDFA